MGNIRIEEKFANPVMLGIIMFIFGISSFIFGLGLFRFHGQLIYFEIAKFLICVSGIMYIISSIFLFSLKSLAKKITFTCSAILLLYFIILSLILNTEPWGWGKLAAPLFLPYILFPWFFIIFLRHPKVKEQFKG